MNGRRMETIDSTRREGRRSDDRSPRMYRLFRRSTTCVVAVALAVAVASGCQSGPVQKPAVDLAGKSNAEILYDAIVVSFRHRDLTVEVASRKHGIVTSTYKPVSERLRRRFTARVVRIPGGAKGLRIQAEYQRRFGGGDDPVWKRVESEQLRSRARRAELALGRAIEERFRRWKEYRRAHGDAGAGAGPDAG